MAEHFPSIVLLLASKALANVGIVFHLSFFYNPFQTASSFCSPSPSPLGLLGNPHLILPINFQLFHIQIQSYSQINACYLQSLKCNQTSLLRWVTTEFTDHAMQNDQGLETVCAPSPYSPMIRFIVSTWPNMA